MIIDIYKNISVYQIHSGRVGKTSHMFDVIIEISASIYCGHILGNYHRLDVETIG